MTSQHQQHRRWAAAVVLLLATAVAPPTFSEPLLRLRSGAYDPTEPGAASPGLLPAEPTAPVATDVVLIQHDGPIRATWRDALERSGGRVLGYVPDHAYLVRIARQRLPAIRALGGTRAVAPYRAEDRIEPGLAAALAEPGEDGESALVRAWGFLDQDAEALAARAAASGLGVATRSVDRTGGGRPIVLLDVPRRVLGVVVASLARDPGIEWLEPAPSPRPLGDDASWLLQSGVADQRPLFATQGLTGVGQTVALADTGLDHEACQFTFAGDPPTTFNTTQPPRVNVTCPTCKVTSYYLIEGADEYDTSRALFHGSRVAGAIAGDNDEPPATRAPRSAPYELAFAPADTGDGMAPGAQLVMQDIAPQSGVPLRGISQEPMLRQAHGSAARIHNSSYGEIPEDLGNGKLTTYAFAAGVDEALWSLRDLTSVWAAGNWGEIDPATCNPGPCQPWDGVESLTGLGSVAKNTITVGASGHPTALAEDPERLIPESSRGPTLEGLMKPDLVAPGHLLTTVGDPFPNPPCATDRLEPATATLGSSFAAGAVSGLAALVRQYFTDGYYVDSNVDGRPDGLRTRADILGEAEVYAPSNALVKAVLLNSTKVLTGDNTGDRNVPCSAPGDRCGVPSFGQGWGRPTLDDSLYFDGDPRHLRVLRDIWNGSGPFDNDGRGDDPVRRGAISDLQVHSFALQLESATQGPLRCTLVWSDPPGSPAAAAPLVNDLDLEVHGPGPNATPGDADDRWFHGNQLQIGRPFSEAYVDPIPPNAWDATNAVEQVWIEDPAAGVYNVRVIARSVPGNGMTDVPAEPGGDRIDSAEQGYALVCSGDPNRLLEPPSVTMSAMPSPAVGCVEDMPVVDFAATCTAASPACEPCSFDWDFGDGTVLRNATATESYTFTTEGLHRATVIGRDACGAETMSAPVEVFIGNKQPPMTAVGNSLMLVKLAPSGIKATWLDIGVPAATWYNLWEFGPTADRKQHVSAVEPQLGIEGLQVSTPPDVLHGRDGGLWNPPAGEIHFLQVRASSCDNQSGP